MSISDELMYKYYELLTDEDVAKIKSDVSSGALHPKNAKVNLSKIIVTQYHGEKAAAKQAEEFDRAFKDKGFPQDIKLVTIPISAQRSITLVSLLADDMRIVSSRGEAKRKIQEGAVEVDGSKISDINMKITSDREYRIRVGRQFKRIKILRPGT